MDLEKVLSVLMIPFFSFAFKNSKEENKIKLFRDGFIDITTKMKMLMTAAFLFLFFLLLIIKYGDSDAGIYNLKSIWLLIQENLFIIVIFLISVVFYLLILIKENFIKKENISFILKLTIFIFTVNLFILVCKLSFDENYTFEFFTYILHLCMFLFILILYTGFDRELVREGLLNKTYKIRENKYFMRDLKWGNLLLIFSLACNLVLCILFLIWYLFNSNIKDMTSIFELIILLMSIYLILDMLSWVLIENNLYQTHKVRILDDKQNIYAEGYIIAKKGNIVLLYNYASLEEVSLDNKFVSLLE